MGQPPMSMLRIGEWRVDARSGQISRNGETARLDERAMRLLLCLAVRPGEVVSIDHLLNEVWSGVSVSPDSVYQAIATLRRQLGDDPRQPAYIATVPRLGYRMVARVEPLHDETPSVPRRSRAPLLWVFGVAATCVLVVLGLLFVNRGP
ncbi:MAG TPA: transcriptional regulator, partial [Bryobacteraceae bacterium]|nr:transcriptional regulator [Bryobacteraceae bacterium]